MSNLETKKFHKVVKRRKKRVGKLKHYKQDLISKLKRNGTN